MKTAAVLRSEYEAKGAAPAFVKYRQGGSTYYISTLTEFANSEKGFNTLAVILENAGIPCQKSEVNSNDVFFMRDGQIQFPLSARDRFVAEGDGYTLHIWVFSPHLLVGLLIEPNMPKLTLYVDTWESALWVNDGPLEAAQQTNRNSTYNELPLHQGWNKLTLKIGKEDRGRFAASFRCDNNSEFLPQLRVSFIQQ